MDNLAAVYEAITPENLKNINVYDDSMRIFIELLEEKSKVSIQTENFFNHHMTSATEEELIKIYLYDYYSMIQKILNNIHIINRFRKENEILRPELYKSTNDIITISNKAIFNYFEIGGSVINENYSGPEFDDTLGKEIDVNPIYKKVEKLKHDLLQVTAENFYFNRIFKETKGFYSSMIYIYDIINKYLTADDERIPLDLKEMFSGTHFIGEPYLYVNGFTSEHTPLTIRTSVPAEPFKFKIRGSIHKTLYKNTVQYLAHPLGFIYDYSQVKQLKLEDYFSISYSYIDSIVEVRCLQGNVEKYDKKLVNVVKYNGTLKLIFDDLSYLYQQDGLIRYYDDQSKLVKEYPISNQCVIYYTYNLSYTSSIFDSITFKETKTLDADNVLILDEIKHRIKYSPKVGLLIGFFNFNSIDRFQDDTNIYNIKNTTDDITVTSFGNLSVRDLVKILDDNVFEMKTKLDVEKIEFKDEIKSYEITLNTQEKVLIDEQKRIKVISTETSDEVSIDNTKDYLTVRIPLNASDEEIIIDSSMITSSNDLKETFKYNDRIKETLRVKLQDNVKIMDYADVSVSSDNIDKYIVNDIFMSKSLINLSDEIQNLCSDSFSIVSKSFINFDESITTAMTMTDIVRSTDILNPKDQVIVGDNIIYKLSSGFISSKGIGEYLVGDGSIISDSDNYKYYDNIDIS